LSLIKQQLVSRIILPVLFIAIAAMAVSTVHAQFTKLHDFTCSPSEGNSPCYVTPVTDGTYVYGTTRYGRTLGKGIVFKINTDGTAHTILFNLFL